MAANLSKLLSIICLFVLVNTQLVRSDTAKITYIDSAVSKGAVCLNGTAPAYSFEQGFGSGVNNWFIFLEGGAWCDSTYDCHLRAQTYYGNVYSREKTYYNGLLTQNYTYNPDFYNWNKVYVIYCDGSSFLGDVEEVDPQYNITYRGSRVFNAVIEDILPKGMDNADNIILSGVSAGGLATILHCDSFRALVPNAKRVKCISDSGFFIHGKNLPGAKEREDYFTRVVKLHGLEKFLPASCTSKMTNPGLCLFPEYLVEDIQTPLFLLESSFEAFQLPEMVTPYIGGGKPEWHYCLNNSLKFCNSTQLQIMQEFQRTFIHTLQNLKYSSSRGMFVHSFYQHGHIEWKEMSTCSSVVDNVLENRSIAMAIGDWFFDRSCFQHIDINHNVPRNSTSPLEFDPFNRKCIRFINDHKS